MGLAIHLPNKDSPTKKQLFCLWDGMSWKEGFPEALIKKIPTQAKLILLIVKTVATFSKKEGGRDREGAWRSLLGQGDWKCTFSWPGWWLHRSVYFALRCAPMNCTFFCICATLLEWKRSLQNKCNRYRISCNILFVDQKKRGGDVFSLQVNCIRSFNITFTMW